ncbi:hypothetical protein DFJ74DRAFT_620249 [Hyaloraphidium curvatum]|nr:hypothetical protein DFJ74DRAFT_620249 [Hyaloraphidium curvatum]
MRHEKKKKVQNAAAGQASGASADAGVDAAGEPATRYHCDNCTADLTDVVRIRCAVCDDFDLCVQCFSKGAEPAGFKHSNDHDYHVMEVLDFSIFSPDWAADEELALVEGCEKFGLGNWEQIAEHIGTKTKEEVDRHYREVYLAAEDQMPPMDRDFDKESNRKELRIQAQEKAAKQAEMRKIPKMQKPLASTPTVHEVAGYMPGRMEFEHEAENEAEGPVKDMVFDDPVDGDEELKLAVLDIYNDKLAIRDERKALIFERGLLDFKKIQTQERRRSKEEKDMMFRFRAFARMMTKEDFEFAERNFTTEIELRNRIAQLQEWRRMGVTTAAQGLQYEKEKGLRQQQRGNAGSLISSRMPPRPIIATPDLGQFTPRASPTPSAVLAATAAGHNRSRPAPAALDLANAEGLELLSESEVSLCSMLRIMPHAYLAIKDKMISECQRLQGLRKRQARELIKIDVNKTSRLWDFFLESRWIYLPKEDLVPT